MNTQMRQVLTLFFLVVVLKALCMLKQRYSDAKIFSSQLVFTLCIQFAVQNYISAHLWHKLFLQNFAHACTCTTWTTIFAQFLATMIFSHQSFSGWIFFILISLPNELALQGLAGFVEQHTVITVNSNRMEMTFVYSAGLLTKYRDIFSLNLFVSCIHATSNCE